MSAGVPHEVVLKVGFLNELHGDAHRLHEYQKVFDVSSSCATIASDLKPGGHMRRRAYGLGGAACARSASSGSCHSHVMNTRSARFVLAEEHLLARPSAREPRSMRLQGPHESNGSSWLQSEAGLQGVL